MNVTILLLNGDPETHLTGCRDIGRKRLRDAHDGKWTVEVASVEELADEFGSDFIAEGSMSLEEVADWVRQGMKPCCGALPDKVVV